VVVAAFACLGFVLLLTPTGSLPSSRWRWWARVSAAAPVVFVVAVTLEPQPLDPAYRSMSNPLGLQALQLPIASGITVAGVVVGALSLVVRFRRARGIERQQLRWVALAAMLVPVAILVALAGMAAGSDMLIIWGAGVSFAVLPPAIGAAILRYRLYDLDRIISRTLAYGLLTVLLAGGYAAVALGLGQLLGRDSSLVVAGATLAVAALFQPARRRIQAVVDRRFNRRKYDAARTVAAFSVRLRDESTWTRSRPSCWPRSTRRCSRPRRRCGSGNRRRRDDWAMTPCMPCSFGPLRFPRSGVIRPGRRSMRSDRDYPLRTAGDRCLWHVGGTTGGYDHDALVTATAPAVRRVRLVLGDVPPCGQEP
jgi:hypothetical protein